MIHQAIRTIRTLLPLTTFVTGEQIEDAVNTVLSIPVYADIEKSVVIREVQAIYNIRMDDYKIIEDNARKMPWISDKKAQIWSTGRSTFWGRYRDYLQIEKNLADTVVNQIDRLTDRTLDGLFDPAINAIISKYGLVVGQVQSGKTSNYTGLICKAADAGFKLIIVLAGIHNNLRSQTQLRLDEGFLGFDTQHQRAFDRDNIWIGVGRINTGSIAHSLTSSRDNGDFSAGAANSLGINFNTNEPIVAVVKKNARVLDRLYSWLGAQATEINGRKTIRNKSFLLIDDEADNASINTNPQDDPATRINMLIRNIIGLFDKSGYVGYTATPFANIFMPIGEDDLFPRDFIVNLPAPSNYIGPERIFGFEPLEDDSTSGTILPIVRRIEDYYQFVPNGHRSGDTLPAEVPDSLKAAIKCFILTCAIRRLRGQQMAHNSMLVHVTRFVVWQHHIKTLVEHVFDFYRRGIEMNVPAIIEEMRRTFEEDTDNYKSYVTTSGYILSSELRDVDPHVSVHAWTDVLVHLNDAASRILVREINGGAADALNYFDHPNGLSVIAIGGDKLSRGLTLEGLSISYYLRASRMYDTLMQMGRWFGYRPGYVDLCRLFTSRELNEWFCHITLASEELRSEFDYMSDIAGSTPEQYALRVRTHPGVLQISASNKIRRAVTVTVSWAGRLVESYEFSRDPGIINRNLNSAVAFIQSLPGAGRLIGGNYLWYDVPVQLIRSLLLNFRLSENLRAADPANLLRFIDAQLTVNEFEYWRVAVMSKSSQADQSTLINKEGEELKVGWYIRNFAPENSNNDIYYLKNSRILSPKDEFIDLTPEEFETVKTKTEALWKDKYGQGAPKYPSGQILRNEVRSPQNPLLLLYFLSPKGANNSDEYPHFFQTGIANPIVGYAISFPGSNHNVPVSYAIHEQLLNVFNQEDNLIELNDDDED